MSFQEVLAPVIVPITVAVVPSVLLALSKKFERAEKSRGRMHEEIEAIRKALDGKIDAHVIEGLEERIRMNETKIARLSGRLNGRENDKED